MNFDFYNQLLNVTNNGLQLNRFTAVVLEFGIGCQSPIEFTPLQSTLLKVLLFLLLGTGVLIAYSWHVYGKVITEKFVKPSTLKEIEELKLSVAKLKLPKEHSPRI